ncbi:serine hydrolase domain-containing protein [Vibrio genomosp. F10]|uniref:Serine hydrolase n=1 Tax=Vibrio genomosp. F10 TaxID=723171 RepID=A0A1B9QXS8_9VIBR|nr:serine hydrolase domain-containing protein [Vibrio genomosp. F10]OCH75026.1 serine hydrolase [Vibrio genomosp. F10]OEE96300.1 serine hydrolase [Vibrio genomosp. F10 str. 9ZC157]OEF08551.1 serine hydrolase [Vibrio genomosp. F10 str. 9ZB36]
MKLKPLTLLVSVLASPVFASSSASSVEQPLNPVEAALKAEGAMVSLPVDAAKESFTPEFIDAARANFNNFHWQMGGDHSMYYNMHMSEFMPTALASPSEEYKPLVKAINKDLGDLKVVTKTKGEMTMDQYVNDPQFRTQGFMLIHEGKIVYEAYPGMKPTDRHIWASSAKTTVGLVTAMLVEEGKIDPKKPITTYIPTLVGTVWDDVTVLDALNHTTGLDNEETLESILNPDSPVVRFFASAFGSPRYSTGEMEGWTDVARDTQKIEGEGAGEHFRYASMNTIVLTKMIENIENTAWTQVFEDRVWSHVTARQPMLFNQTPDGMAIAVGLVETTLEDKARFGTLFTPSWEAVATEQVVTPAIIDRIRNSGDKATYEGTTKQASSVGAFNEMSDYQSYQFDYVFDDGAMAKSGNLGQFIYVDPDRDFVGVVFSSNPYHSGYGESKAPALMRSAAKYLADK